METLQFDLGLEPRVLYHQDQLTIPARFALCWQDGDLKSSFRQNLYDVRDLENIVRTVAADSATRHYWISQATLRPGAHDRRISSIVLLNACWVDIDLAHVPDDFKLSLPPSWRDPERCAAVLAKHIEDAGLPLPTYIVGTGGGLCPKWILEQAIPSAARPRWQSMQDELIKRISQLGEDSSGVRWGWPVDRAASDAARILRVVGSVNPRWGTHCRIVWDSGKKYRFGELADAVLPYTQAQVREFKEQMRQARTWDQNRKKAGEMGIRSARKASSNSEPKVQQTTEARVADEAARNLWAGRFEFGRAVISARGGAKKGNRNNWYWPMANALAWSCTSADQLKHELVALHEDLFQFENWSRDDALASAGSVVKRLADKDLYGMKTKTFLASIEVTGAELTAFGDHLGESNGYRNRSTWHQGAMGFEPMKGLDFEDYLAETRNRQAAGGRYRAAMSRESRQDDRATAFQMRSAGMSSRQIAAELHVNQSTIVRWLDALERR